MMFFSWILVGGLKEAELLETFLVMGLAFV